MHKYFAQTITLQKLRLLISFNTITMRSRLNLEIPFR